MSIDLERIEHDYQNEYDAPQYLLDDVRNLIAEVRRLRQTAYGIRPECPDIFCPGWKDSGICTKGAQFRHHEGA
jgi:hypothetical protein